MNIAIIVITIIGIIAIIVAMLWDHVKISFEFNIEDIKEDIDVWKMSDEEYDKSHGIDEEEKNLYLKYIGKNFRDLLVQEGREIINKNVGFELIRDYYNYKELLVALTTYELINQQYGFNEKYFKYVS
jgi:hypothetical protein